ncbi:FGGY-family carbohydrate kinase [Bifidobacterium sp. ESL0732]|uniref:FGGY-family carbohydrate kinase n=1 Tax=Bifidobacterium sp. ESL0732 TaxID=2983222 RepID=UPI0023F7280E|nr:FGGY-family carbohydrate kinase [Bifidobacterium sp. ESL0732]WEV63423.1 carbohydrate kinase [Bifidobacterium sp. ESL0732]
MAGRYFLILDNGGTNTRALIFDEEGTQVGVSVFDTPWIQDMPEMREIDLKGMRDSLFAAIRQVLERTEVSPKDIACITCVGHGKGLYLLDNNGKIFCNGILSTDERANDLARSFETRVKEIYPISHQHVMASQAPVLLRWIKDHEPERYANIGSILSAKDFVRYLLTGGIHQEIGDASGNNLINLKTRDYDDRLLTFFGISEAVQWRPDLVESADIVDTIDVQAANETGLIEGTPVTGGLFDIDAGTLGSGALDHNHYSVIAGTWSINTYLSHTPTERMPGIMNSLFLKDRVLVEASSPTSSGNLSRILRLLSPTGKDTDEDYERLEANLRQEDADFTQVLYTPFLYGSNSDPDATASFVGLESTTTRMQLVRAVYEGVVFAHRQHIDQLLYSDTTRPQSLRVCGGAANSPSWMQMFADIIGLPVQTVKGHEITGLGGAVLSAYATGDYSNLQQAANRMIHVDSCFEPDAVQHRKYDEKYQRYQILLDALNGVWSKLHATQKEGTR